MAAPAGRRSPERMCVVCRCRRDKRALVRVGLLPDGHVVVDPAGKGPGRGAYLCRSQACWLEKNMERQLSQALKVPLTAADQARLAEYASTLPNVNEDG